MMKPPSKKIAKLLNILVLGAALTTLYACGGGGSSDSTANSNPNSTSDEANSPVSNGDSQVVTDFFVNQLPVFKAQGSHSAKADAGPINVINWAYDIDDGDDGVLQNLKFVMSNDRPDLFDVQPEVSVETGNLTYNAKNKLSGTALISLSLVDDGGVEDEGEDSSVPYNFAINVDPPTVVVAPLIPNKKPTFTANGDHSSKATDGPQALRGWAHDLNDGDENSSQSMNFSVLSNSAPGLFDVQPTVSVPSGTLRYNAKNTVSGKSEITIVLQDDGGTEEGGEDTSESFTFSIDITAPDLNHSPTFLPGGNVSVDSASGSYEKVWATNMDDGDPSSQAMKFVVLENTDPSLFVVQPWVSYPSGKLRFEPNPNKQGTASVRLVLQDNGGVLNGGNDTSAEADFSVSITMEVENALPVANAGVDQSVVEGSTVTLDGSASSDSDGSIVSHEWREGVTVLATTASFSKADFTIGVHQIVLTATDNSGEQANDSVFVTVTQKDISTATLHDNTELMAENVTAVLSKVEGTVSETGQLTFTDPDVIKDWKAGDIKILPPYSDVPSGLAFKVTSIDVSGKIATVLYSTPTIDEVFKDISFDINTPLKARMIKSVEMRKGVNASINIPGMKSLVQTKDGVWFPDDSTTFDDTVTPINDNKVDQILLSVTSLIYEDKDTGDLITLSGELDLRDLLVQYSFDKSWIPFKIKSQFAVSYDANTSLAMDFRATHTANAADFVPNLLECGGLEISKETENFSLNLQGAEFSDTDICLGSVSLELSTVPIKANVGDVGVTDAPIALRLFFILGVDLEVKIASQVEISKSEYSGFSVGIDTASETPLSFTNFEHVSRDDGQKPTWKKQVKGEVEGRITAYEGLAAAPYVLGIYPTVVRTFAGPELNGTAKAGYSTEHGLNACFDVDLDVRYGLTVNANLSADVKTTGWIEIESGGSVSYFNDDFKGAIDVYNYDSCQADGFIAEFVRTPTEINDFSQVVVKNALGDSVEPEKLFYTLYEQGEVLKTSEQLNSLITGTSAGNYLIEVDVVIDDSRNISATLSHPYTFLDNDNDGLNSLEEANVGTNDSTVDSDNDGMSDGYEVTNGLNPLVDDADQDSDKDSYTNIVEYNTWSHSNDASDTPGILEPVGYVKSVDTVRWIAASSATSYDVIIGSVSSTAYKDDIDKFPAEITGIVFQETLSSNDLTCSTDAICTLTLDSPIVPEDSKHYQVYIVGKPLIVNKQFASKFELDTAAEPLENEIPIANAGSDQTVAEGGSVTLDASVSVDNDGIIVSYSWKENDSVLSTLKVFTKSDFSVGTHTIVLEVTDDSGETGSDEVIIVIQELLKNEIPIANAGSDQTVTEGAVVTLNASGSIDIDGAIASYSWKENDNVLSTLEMFTKSDFSVGTHTIVLEVTDDDRGTGSDEVVVVVEELIKNVIPTANAGSDQAVTVGSTVIFDGSGSSDSDGEILSFEWRDESGVMIGSEITFSKSDFDVGIHVITLTVIDDDGEASRDTVTITVEELAQALQIISPSDGYKGEVNEIRWKGSKGSSSYGITWHRVGSGNQTQEVVSPAQSGCIDPILDDCVYAFSEKLSEARYKIIVYSLDKDSNSLGFVETEFEAVAPVENPPLAPSNVSAIPGENELNIEWEGSEKASSYNVYFAFESFGNPSEIENYSAYDGGVLVEGVTDSRFTITGLENDKKVFVVVTAENNGGESEPSEEVSSAPVLYQYLADTNVTLAVFRDHLYVLLRTQMGVQVHRFNSDTWEAESVFSHRFEKEYSLNSAGIHATESSLSLFLIGSDDSEQVSYAKWESLDGSSWKLEDEVPVSCSNSSCALYSLLSEGDEVTLIYRSNSFFYRQTENLEPYSFNSSLSYGHYFLKGSLLSSLYYKKSQGVGPRFYLYSENNDGTKSSKLLASGRDVFGQTLPIQSLISDETFKYIWTSRGSNERSRAFHYGEAENAFVQSDICSQFTALSAASRISLSDRNNYHGDFVLDNSTDEPEIQVYRWSEGNDCPLEGVAQVSVTTGSTSVDRAWLGGKYIRLVDYSETKNSAVRTRYAIQIVDTTAGTYVSAPLDWVH